MGRPPSWLHSDARASQSIYRRSPTDRSIVAAGSRRRKPMRSDIITHAIIRHLMEIFSPLNSSAEKLASLAAATKSRRAPKHSDCVGAGVGQGTAQP